MVMFYITHYLTMETLSMGLTPSQRHKIRQYLDRARKRKEYEKSLKNRAKIFSGIKKVVKVGFVLLLMMLIYIGVKIS